MKTISIIIVSWNAREYLRDCLNSVNLLNDSPVLEIIVVDNDSKDGSAEMVESEFKEAILIRAGENLGFSKANNLAMKMARGSLFALVNSDVIIHSGCLETLSMFMDQNPNVGLVGPRIIGGDGKLQRTCRKLPNYWNTICRILALDRVFSEFEFLSGFEVSPLKHEKLSGAEVLSGCFLVARKKAVDEVGGMDEQFFFYGEDVDWSKRFRDFGWKLMFVPAATATHFGGGSSSNAPLRFSIEYHRANLKYWKKHHGILGYCIYYLLIIIHHAIRLVARLFKRFLGLGNSIESKHKLMEDLVCLRWLLIGTEL